MPLSISEKGVFLTGQALTKISQATISSSGLHISTADASCSIQLISSSEMQTVPTQTVDVKLTAIDEASIFPIGIRGDPTRDVYYISIAWNAGQLMRKKLSLPPKPSRVTLNAEHAQDDIDTPLLYTIPQGELSLDALDHIAFRHLQLGRLQQARELTHESRRKDGRGLGTSLCSGRRTSSPCWRLAVSYTYPLRRRCSDTSSGVCWSVLSIRNGGTCSRRERWNSYWRISSLYCSFHGLTTCDPNFRISMATPSLSLDSRILLTTTLPNATEPFELPSFFRWIVPFHFAVMSTPRNEDDISVLASPILGIRHVVTLTEEAPLDEEWFVGKRITHTHMPIEHYQCPTLEQVDLIIEMSQDENKVPLLCTVQVGRGGRVQWRFVIFRLRVQHIEVREDTTSDVTFSCYRCSRVDPTEIVEDTAAGRVCGQVG